MKKLINALFAVAMISATFVNVAFAEEEGGEGPDFGRGQDDLRPEVLESDPL